MDLLIIGGGINGVGIARDAAGRGLSVLLVEKDDLAAHTSQWSSKLIHGGLRYLEQYEFRLVSEALAEREVLLRVAPHLIRPLRFVLPHAPHLRPRWMLRAGLWLYDGLGRLSGERQTLPRSFATSLAEGDRIPWGAGLKPEYREGFVYCDAQVDDARLVVENAKDAQARGAHLEVGTAFLGAERRDGLWQVRLRRRADGAERCVAARALVNAAGPWVKAVGDTIRTAAATDSVRHIKGSHILVPRVHEGEHAYILQHVDGRVVFVIPYLERLSLIGTTDVPVADYTAPTITEQEIDYLLSAVNAYFNRPVTRTEIVATYAGVRSLYDDGHTDPKEVTRDYVLRLDTTPEPGRAVPGAPLLTIYGGKITTYRKLAEHALEALLPFFPAASRHSWTHAPLQAGATPARLRALEADLVARGFTGAYARRLVHRYGLVAERLTEGGPSAMGECFEDVLAEREIEYLRDHEWARDAEAILTRRTKVGILASPESLPRIRAAIAAILGSTASAA
ncbi:MAG: glycerol-3-phosphate dehydrogenase [Casimicrobiaceae bacterium]|nr:glycerol-3-phosphate dehydrogenase [Casimicrobiaceae bacterium]